MNNTHFEEQIKLVLEDSEIDEKQAFLLFKDLWSLCRDQASKSNNSESFLKPLLSQFSKETYEMQTKIKTFSTFLKDVPLMIALGYWIKGILNMDEFWRKKYFQGIKNLLEMKVIHFVNYEGNNLTLEEFRKIGHQEIIENIRCAKEWSFFQKEEAVQSYLQFSHSLARDTLNFVPSGYDPDRNRTCNRFIQYEDFLEFVQHLSVRDALIAKLIYFGAPSIEEILSLKINAINSKKYLISFKKNEVVFPKHLIGDLVSYLQEKSDQRELMFTNVRGSEVERAHLNHAFSRASEKISSRKKITPGSLLKLKNEISSGV
ncbi:MAG: site-specific integrase [Chlamydiae bacterium]|nr:site-specific integrase [Chlamydiota bacterium]